MSSSCGELATPYDFGHKMPEESTFLLYTSMGVRGVLRHTVYLFICSFISIQMKQEAQLRQTGRASNIALPYGAKGISIMLNKVLTVNGEVLSISRT